MNRNQSPLLKAMEDAVLKAGRALSRDFGEVENLQVSKKGPQDFVTSADLRADKILREELEKFRPDYGFLTEESGEIPGKDDKHRWIIDPLDGTTNFIHSIPYFCISVALEATQPNGKKEIVAGIIHAPILQETYYAEKGQGGFINNRRLLVSGRTNIEDALISVYHGKEDGNAVASMDVVRALGCKSRSMGAAALDIAYVAAGKLDGFWHSKLKSWDVAAGILLVQEAKGIITDIEGGSDMLTSGTILATNQSFHDTIRQKLVRHYK